MWVRYPNLMSFFQDPLIQVRSDSAPETSRNALGTKQATKKDDSQSDPHPQATVSQKQTTRNFGPDDDYGMVTGVQGEVTYCSFETSSGKQEEYRSASQPQICIEIIPATSEAD